MAAKIRVVLTETAVNTSANTSTVKAVVQYYGNGTSHNGYASQCKITLKVNGKTYKGNHAFTKSKKWQTLKTVTGITIPHNADGTKTVSYSASYTTGVSLGTLKTSGSKALTSIARRWTVSYNANGGTGAPAAQTKSYGSTLILSSIIPTRTGYRFLGWATSSTGAVAYQPGGQYTANAGATLYAIWELAYLTPTITSLNAVRVRGNTYDEEGRDACLTYSFTPAKHYENGVWVDVVSSPTITLTIGSDTYHPNASPFYTTGELYNTETEYNITLTISYTLEGTVYSATKNTFLSMAVFTMDVNKIGSAVAFGGSAPDNFSGVWQGVYLNNVKGTTDYTTALSNKGLANKSVEEIIAYILNHI